jgi:hypothetical protein
MTLSRGSAVATMRGESCALAIWIVTSIEPKVNTMNVRFIVMLISSAEITQAN